MEVMWLKFEGFWSWVAATSDFWWAAAVATAGEREGGEEDDL